MQKKRIVSIALFFAGLLPAASATAMGIGPVALSTVLGQPLDHVLPLRLEADETLTPECVSAEVVMGEHRVLPSAVATRIEGQGQNLRLRVLTLTAVDEPVVTLQVALGCPSRLSRRYVLFADPAPDGGPAMAVVPAAVPLVSPAPAPDEARAPAPASARVATASAPVPAARTVAPRPRAAQADRAERLARADDGAPRPRPRARPRLRLDAADPLPPTPTPEAIEAAASAAEALSRAQDAAAAASAAASAAEGRIVALEQAIEKMRADAAADRQALLMLRQRAAEGDSASRWLPWLLALVAVLLALSAALLLKLRRLQAEQRQAWMQVAAGQGGTVPAPRTEQMASRPEPLDSEGPPPTGPGSLTYPTTRPGTLGPVLGSGFSPTNPGGEGPLASGETTQALPPGWRPEAEPARDLSIEELIDLEQQAEFFIVLGQEDAAVDLLVDHLRSTGGVSPMPYLKLLEIYRRRDDREAYERTRARFNHRFNAYAPDWDNEAHEGRTLEDYPAIVTRLQLAWASPIDAMAELEALMFRKSRGELFDMPAYRDVLFLYSLARDLLDREPLESGNVDVLLPISEGGDYTQPMSFEEQPEAGDSGLLALDNQPTVPVDLDITQPVMPDSLFGDPVTDPGPNRRRH